MKKRWGFVVFAMASLLMLSARTVHAAADWDEDDEAAKGTKLAARVRSYPGGADEQDLKVQTVVPASGRLPDAPAHPDKNRSGDEGDTPTDD